jgi:hypothetical protein
MSFGVGTSVTWKQGGLPDAVGTVVEVRVLDGENVNMVREPNGTLHAFPDRQNALTPVA